MKSPKFGQTLPEVLISTAIFSIVITLALVSFINLSSSTVRSRFKSQAVNYAKEGIEICYNLSLQNWSQFISLADPGKTYYPVLRSNLPADPPLVFKLEEGEETINGKYTRSIIIEEATDADIDEVFKITTRVSFNLSGRDQQVEMIIYLTNLRELI